MAKPVCCQYYLRKTEDWLTVVDLFNF